MEQCRPPLLQRRGRANDDRLLGNSSCCVTCWFILSRIDRIRADSIIVVVEAMPPVATAVAVVVRR
jgi:hypothetical protein